jgi:hypothetical protein
MPRWRGAANAEASAVSQPEDSAAGRPSELRFQCSRADTVLPPIPPLPSRADPSFSCVFKEKISLIMSDSCCWEDPGADRDAKFATTSTLDQIFELGRSTHTLSQPVIDCLLQLVEYPLFRDRSPPDRLSQRCDELVSVAEVPRYVRCSSDAHARRPIESEVYITVSSQNN